MDTIDFSPSLIELMSMIGDKRIDESIRRLESARHFEESDRVPILIDVGAPFFARVLGYTLKDFYRDLGICKRVQVEGSKWAFKALEDDRTGFLGEDDARPDIGAVAEGIVFDCSISLPDDRNPWLSPWIIPSLRSLTDIESLEVPDPRDCVRRLREHYVRAFGREIHSEEATNIHPPCSAAGSLMGPEMLYTFLYKYPDVMHGLFMKLLDTLCAITDYNDELRGGKTRDMGLCDDHAGYLSEDMYRKFVLPYNKRIYERYGADGRSLHMDSRTDHIARILLEEYGIQEMDLGAASDIAKIKNAFDGKVVFNGNVDSKILVAGSIEQIERATEHCIKSAAQGGGYILDCGGETYAGIDPDRLIYMVRYAKKIGKYPIR